MGGMAAIRMHWKRILLVLVALLVINVPYLTHEWELHRAATDGLQVTATVVGVSRAGSDAVVDFRLPASVDPTKQLRAARVDATTGAAAAQTGRIDVRVLKGHPGVFHVDGQVRSWGATIITVVADLLILLLLALSWRLGGRIRRPALVAVALADVESGEDWATLDKQADGTYLINGEIAETGPDSMVLVLRDRDVTVHLRGHRNPVGVGERAQVRAHLVG